MDDFSICMYSVVLNLLQHKKYFSDNNNFFRMFYSVDLLRKNINDIVESKFSKAKLLGQEIMTTKGQPAHVYGQDSPVYLIVAK